MKRRNLLIAIVVLIVVGAIGGIYLHFNPVGPALAYKIIETGDRQHREDNEYYTIQINYPDKTPLATRGAWGAESRAESAIATALTGLIEQFKQAGSVDNLSKEEKDRLKNANLKYSLSVGYHPYTSGSYVSYEFEVYMDTGGAHPNNFYKTLVFDNDGHLVSLGDLFTPGSDYLNRIAGIATTQVEDQLRHRIGSDPKTSFLSDGTAPRADNFNNFVVDSDRVRIFIPPYQAAAYAAGSFEVQIPFSEVKDILKPTVK
jgi:hypothetical protein